MPKAIVFDDGRGELSPMSDLRPSFDIRTGALTTLERLRRSLDLDVIGLYVHADHLDLARERHDEPVNEQIDGDPDEPVVAINGRCALPLEVFAEIETGQVLVEKSSGDLIAAALVLGEMREFLAGGSPSMESVEIEDDVLLARPWHFRRVRDQAIAIDMMLLLKDQDETQDEVPEGVLCLGDYRILIDPEAEVYRGVVLNAEHGPIVIGANATIRPLAVINGPALIGRGCTVFEHANIKPNTAIGPVCKVAGEVGGCVFQGYANKAHEGHLGDSWIGEWANLGAGTTNSNLLNTYTEVIARATPDAKHERTGQTFLGAIIGDHVKTAICTRLMTGAILNTGVMYAATAPASGTIGAFSWVTDDGAKPFRLGKFVEIAMQVMGRRGVDQTQAYARRLTVLHERATGEAAPVSWPGKPAI
ncbi:MAG: putative sugar nucleotidyl transferase [Phycisphaerales bacterium]